MKKTKKFDANLEYQRWLFAKGNESQVEALRTPKEAVTVPNNFLWLNKAKKKDLERGLPPSRSGVDEELMSQCAYYPRLPYWRPDDEKADSTGWVYPCEHCSFESPNESCRRAHILTLSPEGKVNEETELGLEIAREMVKVILRKRVEEVAE